MKQKSIIAFAALSSFAMAANAQEDLGKRPTEATAPDFVAVPEAAPTGLADTVAMPRLSERGTVAAHTPPGPWGQWGDWRLHPGLNASLSLSATVGFGDNAGSGFAQSIALMYAAEIMPKLSLAVGGYYSHFNWGAAQFNDAGLTAVLNYRFNERWEASVFGQKSMAQPDMPLPLYYMGDFGDKIGAEVRYNVSPSFTIGLSVWHQSAPDRRHIAPMRRP